MKRKKRTLLNMQTDIGYITQDMYDIENEYEKNHDLLSTAYGQLEKLLENERDRIKSNGIQYEELHKLEDGTYCEEEECLAKFYGQPTMRTVLKMRDAGQKMTDYAYSFKIKKNEELEKLAVKLLETQDMMKKLQKIISFYEK